MAKVFLGVGSNIDREKHIRAGLSALREQFIVHAISSVYESASIGFDGNPFYNLVVQVTTDLAVGQLQGVLRELEYANGCLRKGQGDGSRTLDIDILVFDSIVDCVDGVILPREEILLNAFVLWPMSEIAPGELHPVRQKNYQTLWSEFDKDKQVIHRVDFIFAE
jgi:2-amino-4-hydroxy-6-hydroxymethyldihydropteridine diphosphokinase